MAKKLKDLGWNNMFDQIVWKAPTTKSIKEVKESQEEFYDGEGNLVTQLQSGVSTGNGGLKKIIIGYHTMKSYPESVGSLAKSLTGISNFTPYGLTDIYDVNGNILFSEVIYDSLEDLSSALIKSESYQNMFYISHYYYIDQTYKSPRIFSKNLAYWTLVGKPNYTNKRQSSTIGNYFENSKDEIQYSAHLALCGNLSIYLMNNYPEWYNAGVDSYSISQLTFGSQYDSYFSWPHFKLPMSGPQNVNLLYNAQNESLERAERMKGELTRGFPMDLTKWTIKSIHKVDFTFDDEIKETRCVGSMIWKNNSIREWSPSKQRKVYSINRETKLESRKKKTEIENHGIKNQSYYWSYSSIILFEMTNTDSFNGYESGAYRYFLIKPFGEDFFSMQNSTDLYNEDFVYISIEEDGKKPILDRVKLSKLVWPHLFNEKSFTEGKGWIGNFSLFQLPISNWSSKFDKYLKSTQITENGFKIRFMLGKYGDDKHGYFIQPSDQILTITKTKIPGLNQIKTKYIGS